MNQQFATIQSAIAFAARAHEGQFRKDGVTPYASHLFRVCLAVSEVFELHDADLLAAAVLHDTIEDTRTDYDDIVAAFGANVADWVQGLSKDKRLPEQQREEEYADGLAKACWQIQVLKLADILDNFRDVEQLPLQRRQTSLDRLRWYLSRMGQSLRAEAKAPFEMVAKLVGE